MLAVSRLSVRSGISECWTVDRDAGPRVEGAERRLHFGVNIVRLNEWFLKPPACVLVGIWDGVRR